MEMSEYDAGLRKQELLVENVPQKCPYCAKFDNIEWTEFKIHLSDVFYFDRANEELTRKDVEIVVFCTRCNDHVLEQDWKVSR